LALQLGSELARSTTLFALAGVPSPVATFPVTTAAAAEWSSLALALAHHSSGRSMGPLLLDVCRGDNLCRKMEPLSEVVKALKLD